VIATGVDDQRYALGDWRSSPPRRGSGHATLAKRNADHNLSIVFGTPAGAQHLGAAELFSTLPVANYMPA
jgi:hypothetical protein